MRGIKDGRDTARRAHGGIKNMSRELQLRLSLHHRALRLLRPLALILQRALRGLGLRLALLAFRRPRRPRLRPPQVLHLEDRAGGCPSVMVGIVDALQSLQASRVTTDSLLQVVARQSEPLTATLDRGDAAFCTAGAAERLSASNHNENCREHDLLQAPELVSTTFIISGRYIPSMFANNFHR